MHKGEKVPASVNYQALYEAEEAELQRAIEESKAMMELMQIAEQAEKEKPKAVVKEEPKPVVKSDPTPVVKEEPKPAEPEPPIFKAKTP